MVAAEFTEADVGPRTYIKLLLPLRVIVCLGFGAMMHLDRITCDSAYAKTVLETYMCST